MAAIFAKEKAIHGEHAASRLLVFTTTNRNTGGPIAICNI